MKRLCSIFCILLVLIFFSGIMIACNEVASDTASKNSSSQNTANSTPSSNNTSNNTNNNTNNNTKNTTNNNTNGDQSNNQNSQNSDSTSGDQSGAPADPFAPTTDLYLGEYADQQIDISAIKNDTSLSGSAERVAKMIINASYNNIFINQFYFKASADIQMMTQPNKFLKSEYFRAKNGANMYYHYLTYTGDINVAGARIDYVDERVQAKTMSNVNYNRTTGEWSYGLNNVKESTYDRPVSLPDPTPYNIYSWYDFPIDLGGIKSCNGNSGRTADIDYSLIDEKSVVIEEKVDENNNAYYRINFKAIIAKAMASAETKDRFSDSFNSLRNVDFSELAFEVDIWKDAGVFRKIGINAHVTASMGNNRGEVEIEKVLAFSYDDTDCSVAAHIKKFADTFTTKWIRDLSEANQTQLFADLLALEKKQSAQSKTKLPVTSEITYTANEYRLIQNTLAENASEESIKEAIAMIYARANDNKINHTSDALAVLREQSTARIFGTTATMSICGIQAQADNLFYSQKAGAVTACDVAALTKTLKDLVNQQEITYSNGVDDFRTTGVLRGNKTSFRDEQPLEVIPFLVADTPNARYIRTFSEKENFEENSYYLNDPREITNLRITKDTIVLNELNTNQKHIEYDETKRCYTCRFSILIEGSGSAVCLEKPLSYYSDNNISDVNYTQYDIVLEVWENGYLNKMQIIEAWTGTSKIVKSETTISENVFSETRLYYSFERSLFSTEDALAYEGNDWVEKLINHYKTELDNADN